jgi:hypothetical protein
MPTRILRDLTTSDRFNRASYFDQSFYIRLLNKVDDYGRHEANATLLASVCFPYGDADIGYLPMQPLKVEGGLRSLASKGLIYVYNVGGKQYVYLHKWRERIRTASRCPDQNSGTPVYGDLSGMENMLEEPEKITIQTEKSVDIAEIHASKILAARSGQMPCECQSNTSQPSDKCTLPTPYALRPTPNRPSPECPSNDSQLSDKRQTEPGNPVPVLKPLPPSKLTALKANFNSLFNRPSNAPWAYDEESLLAEISRRPDCLSEFSIIVAHRRTALPEERKYLKGRDVLGLARDWTQALDQARAATGKPSGEEEWKDKELQASIQRGLKNLVAKIKINPPTPRA